MSKGGSSSSSSSSSWWWSRCMKAPMRVLCGIRDLYVRGMTACSGKVGQYRGAGVACPTFSSDLAWDRSSSFSSSSSRRSDGADDDLRELIRAASRARYADLARAEVRRSQSAVVGRIDEDRPCEFEEGVTVGSSLVFPRSSSSHAGVGVGIKKRRSKANVFA